MLLGWMKLKILEGILLIGIRFVVFRWELMGIGSIIRCMNRNLIALIKSLSIIIWIFITKMMIKRQKESIWIHFLIIKTIKKNTFIKQIAVKTETISTNLTKTYKRDTIYLQQHSIKIVKINDEILISMTMKMIIINHNFTHS